MASTRPDRSGKHRADVAGPAVDRHDRRRRREDRMKPREPVPRIRAGHRIFFHEQGEPLFGPGTFDLLVLVDETGSLHQAAKLMGMSYNKAWRAMRQAEDHLGLKLMTRRTGGPDGGGSVLTDDGHRLMERFRAFLDEADADLARLYQKYFGDASFAQPAQPPAASPDDAS
jgi:molybdate transport system regulatory protein